MKDNLFFWHWNEFLIQDQMKFWKDNFISKHWEINFEKLDINSNSFNEILWALLAPPFLWEKRLVFIKWIPGWTKDKKLTDDQVETILNNLQKVDETSLVVFISSTPDKRTRAFKQITKELKAEDFKHPDKNLNSWIEKYCEKRQIKISSSNIKKLSDLAGSNLFRITNEIKKLQDFKNWEEILAADIEQLVWDSSEVNIFKITALISSGRKLDALRELQDLIRAWEDLVHIFNLIVRQFRLLVWAFEIKHLSSAEIAKELKLAPFAASSLKNQVWNFDLETLLTLHKKIYTIDKNIKTWKLKLDSKWNKLLALEIEKELILA